MTHFHAYPNTADYLFDIHASVTNAKSSKFSRKDFSAIVASFAVEGRPSEDKRRLPPAYYAFRNEAAMHPADQLVWVAAQCKERAGDPMVHLYQARLLELHDKEELAAREFIVAADLLTAKAERSEQETNALLESLDTAAGSLARKKAFKEAIPYCTRIVDVTKDAASDRAKRYRGEALFNLAICHAQTKDKDQALRMLTEAIAVEPEFKERAQKNAMLEPLRSDPRFGNLTKAK